MGAWKYCYHCDSPLSTPTKVDFIIGKMRCEDCDADHEIDDDYRRAELEELFSTEELLRPRSESSQA